jgi:lysophospholipase L1-like esterase
MVKGLVLPTFLTFVVLAWSLPVVGASDEIAYLALGDSVASGAVLGEAASYPRLLGHRLANETGRSVRYLNRARAGEQSAGVVAHQLDGLAEFQPGIVTLTVGANDFLVPTYECIISSVDRAPGLACNAPDPRTVLPSLESNLRAIVGRVARDTSATLVITTYYNPFPRGAECGSILADAAMHQLNAVIARAASEAPDRAVVLDLMPVFRGHEGQEPSGWFLPNPLRLACADIHPGVQGQAAIAGAVWDLLTSRRAI